MDFEDLFGFLVATLVFLLIVAGVVWSCIGIHVETGHGQHTGYVTAVEQNGLFFKTWRVYVKTDTQSSQEDAYCVTDQSVIDELTKAVETKQHVTLSYFSWFAPGIGSCKAEKAIIKSFVPLPN